MRMIFYKWLIAYKEISKLRADRIMESLETLSDEVMISGGLEYPIMAIDNYIALAKLRKGFIKERSSADIKALNLFGEYLQMKDILRLPYECNSHEIPLVQYCSHMKIAYSYKLVFISSLLQKNGNAEVDSIVEEMISFYKDRMLSGKAGEKRNSIFSELPIDEVKARNTICSNPLKILLKDGVIIQTPKTNKICFSSRYWPYQNVHEIVQMICQEKILSYYDKMDFKNSSMPVEVKDAVWTIYNEIDSITNLNDKEEMKELFTKIVLRLYSDFQCKREEISLHIPLLDINDSRKVGLLVQEVMQLLSDIGFVFSTEQIRTLANKEESKRIFGLFYPFWIEIDPSSPIKGQGRDHNGRKRYWDKEFVFGEKKYLITSQWYADDKIRFIRWFNDNIANG